MIRLAAALGAVVVIAVLASAVNGQEPDGAGRYQLTADGDGFLRLDTATGAVSYCAPVDGIWRCQPADTPAATAAAIADLTARLAGIETAIAALVGGDEAANTQQILTELAILVERFAALDGALAAFRADEDEARAALAATIAELSDRVAAVELGIVALGAADPATADDYAALAANQAAIEAALADVIAAIAAGPPELAGARAELEALAIAVERLRADQVELGEQLAGQERLSEDALERLAELRSDQAVSASRLARLLGDLADRFDGLETEMTDGAPEAVEAILAALDERLAAFETAVIADVAGQRAETAEAFEDLLGRIDEIATQQQLLSLALTDLGEAAIGAPDVANAVDAALVAIGDDIDAAIGESLAIREAEMVSLRSEIALLQATLSSLSDLAAAGTDLELAERLAATELRLAEINNAILALGDQSGIAELIERVDELADGQAAILAGFAEMGAERTAPLTPEPAAEPPAEGNTNAEQATDRPGFGEEVILRLYELVGGLKRSLGD